MLKLIITVVCITVTAGLAVVFQSVMEDQVRVEGISRQTAELYNSSALDPKPTGVGGISPIKSAELRVIEEFTGRSIGRIMLLDRGDATSVEIVMDDKKADDQPAHIHSGTCADTGPVKYELSPLKDGYSFTLLSIQIDRLMEQSPLAFNFHRSSTTTEEFYGCARLQ